MSVLGLDAVILLHQLLSAIREHAGYCQVRTVENNILYIEAHDVYKCSMFTIRLETARTEGIIRPIVVDIRSFIAIMPTNTIARIRQDARGLYVSDANTTKEQILVGMNDHVPYLLEPFDYNPSEYLSIAMYTTDFNSIANHLCMGDGIVQITVQNNKLTFYSNCEYGTIHIEKTIIRKDNTATNGDAYNITQNDHTINSNNDIVHGHIVAKHMRCIPTHIRQLHVLISKRAKQKHVIGLSAGFYIVWLHALH